MPADKNFKIRRKYVTLRIEVLNESIMKSGLNRKICIVFLSMLSFSAEAIAQERKNITPEDIWQKYLFFPRTAENINWMRNGRYYTDLTDQRIVRYDVTDGREAGIIVDLSDLKANGKKLAFESYEFSSDEKKILLLADKEPVYRRSFKGNYYIFDLDTKTLTPLSKGGKQSYADFSPDGTKVAFVRDNNLFYTDLKNMREVQVTRDGRANEIINGSTDWVYEEEFYVTKAFFWSPDGSKIAYSTFDERAVPEYNLQLWQGLYPKDYRFKYPKAGEKNSEVSVSVFHLSDGKTVRVNLGSEKDVYIPRINWTQNPELLSIRRMNRLQNKLELLHADARTGATAKILEEISPTYIDLEFTDDLTYLKNGKQFIWSSERDGYKHLYLYDMAGKLIRQITKGPWEVTDFLGVDERKGLVYYTSKEVSPLERHLYVVSVSGKNKKRLTLSRGVNEIDMSRDFSYYISTNSRIDTPHRISLHRSTDGRELRVLEDNADLKQTMSEYALSPVEFFSFKTSEGVSLNGYMIKPTDFNSSKKYPVLMYVYGGPGDQKVIDEWEGNFMWHQMLAQQGYIVACVDNRGTGGRGEAFKKSTYGNLGALEVKDQTEAAKYLGNLPYVDRARIGIWGWSFGGYMTLLCLTRGNEIFKTGIAVAPVTNWRFYDTIYTERFLQKPQDNPGGYDNNSPVTYADRLRGALLLVHGTGDDNVHVQNSMEMQNALIRSGKQFESFFYPNRNHGIYGGNTRLHLYTMMTDFIRKNL